MKVRKLHGNRKIANGNRNDDQRLLRTHGAGQRTQRPPSPGILTEATMMLRAKEAVLEGADWLTATQVASIAGLSEKNPNVLLDNWKRDGEIFSLRHHGLEYFPGYALEPGDDRRPYRTLKKVLEQFGGTKDGWGLAYWFQSVNSFLGGRRPMDMLANDSDEVIAAAADEAMGVVHA